MRNSEQLHSLYTELKLQDMLSALVTDSAESGNLETLTASFGKELGLPVIICDSLHLVLAASPDVHRMCGSELSWNRLIQLALVPDIHMPVGAPAVLPEMPADAACEISLGGFLKLHLQESPNNDVFYLMCDIFESGSLIMKLTVTSQLEFTDAQLKSAFLFAAVLQLAYCRMHRGLSEASSENSRFLAALLNGSTEAQSVKWSRLYQTLGGNHLLVCASLQDVSSYHLHFRSFLEQQLSPSCISVQNREHYAVLVSGCDCHEAAQKLDQFAQNHRLKLAVSEPFSRLEETTGLYSRLLELLQTLSGFQEVYGAFREDAFRIYLMFERIYQSEHSSSMVHPDAVRLAEYDDTHETEYIQTLFCWLLCDRKTTAASRLLYLHRNTVDQRLSRLSTMISSNWKDPSYLLSMLYSCYIILRDQGSLRHYRELSESASDNG